MSTLDPRKADRNDKSPLLSIRTDDKLSVAAMDMTFGAGVFSTRNQRATPLAQARPLTSCAASTSRNSKMNHT